MRILVTRSFPHSLPLPQLVEGCVLVLSAADINLLPGERIAVPTGWAFDMEPKAVMMVLASLQAAEEGLISCAAVHSLRSGDDFKITLANIGRAPVKLRKGFPVARIYAAPAPFDADTAAKVEIVERIAPIPVTATEETPASPDEAPTDEADTAPAAPVTPVDAMEVYEANTSAPAEEVAPVQAGKAPRKPRNQQ